MKKLNYLILLLIFPFISNYPQFDTKGIKELSNIEKIVLKLAEKGNRDQIDVAIDNLSDSLLYRFIIEYYNGVMKDYRIFRKMLSFHTKRYLDREESFKFSYIMNNLKKIASKKISNRIPKHYLEFIEIPFIWKGRVLTRKKGVFDEGYMQYPMITYTFEIEEIVKSNQTYIKGDTVTVINLFSLNSIPKLDVSKSYLIFVSITSDEKGNPLRTLFLKPIGHNSVYKIKPNGIFECNDNKFEFAGINDWNSISKMLKFNYGGGLK